MPLIETKGAASAQGFGEFTVVGPPPNYIEDVFSTWLYTGNGSTQTINNGIDLAGKGGLVWMKARSIAYPNFLIDTVRGRAKPLSSDTADAASTSLAGYDLTSFNSTGFSLGPDWVAPVNTSNDTFASWTFREQPKFFDVVTYTGNGSNRTISHNLGSTPGCIIVKRTDASANWQVYHRSLTSAAYSIQLNLSNAEASATTVWNSTAPTSTVFSVGTDSTVNANGGTYVAYLFAHNAGGFGLSGSDNVISCGSFTTDGTGKATVTLGYEPQWIIAKRTNSAGDWYMADVMRGMPVGSATSILTANLSAAEYSSVNFFSPTATGFLGSSLDSSAPFIYVAIRRGPMKVPTSGTSVFAPVTQTLATGSVVTTGFVTDMGLSKALSAADPLMESRLTKAYLRTNTTGAESSGLSTWDYMNGYGPTPWSGSGLSSVAYGFRRAPGFFDVVCYTGTGSATTQAHNLGVAPEMMIVKSRANTGQWSVYASARGANQVGQLQSTVEFQVDTNWNFTAPTSSVFSISGGSNISSYTYVAYLFATCAGVSKVGSYTGTGALQTINCGFTGGARFVLIKRTDSTGDWYVYDSARGISSGSDPYLFLNSTAAEVTGTNYVDTTSVGFQVTAAAPAGLNANGGTYIFLAIA